MNKLFRSVILFGCLFTLVHIRSHVVPQLEIYLFVNPNNIGDRNQVFGIDKELRNILPVCVESKNVNINSDYELEKAIAQIHDNIEDGKKTVVITSGEDGIDLILKLPIDQDLITCHSSHQITQKHKQILGVAKIMALPMHAIDESFKSSIEKSSTFLVETIGVAHNLSIDELMNEANKLKGLIPSDKRYMAVIIAGDAPTPEGEMLYYGRESSRKLAQVMAEKISESDRYLLILNGPRTGKYNSQNGLMNQLVHRDGNMDLITKTFVDTLLDSGLKEGDSFTLFDFQFGQPSLYKAVLGVLLQDRGNIFVPGESTSMISECIDNLPGLVTIYLHEAMNDTHKAHVQMEYVASRANVLDHGMFLKAPNIEDAANLTESACQKIAKAIKNY